MKSTQLGNLLGTAGVIYGIYYGIEKNKKLGEFILYTAIFGIGGAFIGNAISKMSK